ncbi:MAG: zinc ribbon domain-containing protein [Planctomycetota bacterium]
MPTYVYETIPESDDKEPTQFEIVQRMADDPLTHHPETGEKVRRLISGGMSLPVSSSKSGGGCCSSGCSCG